MYLHDCSIERMIPIYLIVSGVVPLLFSGFSRHDDEGRSLGFGDCCGIFAFLFNVRFGFTRTMEN
ncbi:hypothetical protein MAR_013698 [Mya arenaria]|uniref:Uncharacterized protein n=1 Tax=Mya arenaria TaxID=6604 RepID=A0ABY7G3Y3_MYAAR|nr:hypothetical protein MAR_013698 [Mya arenaria]